MITVDFETYYDKDYSLSKMTTEEYIRDDRFEVIGVAVAVDDDPPEWFSGTQKETAAWLNQFDWSNSLVLAHNTQFDGAIMSWVFNIKPKGWLDTLCMARAKHGVEAGGSLKALAERYNLGEKGNEVINALGKRRIDFSSEDLAKYSNYCINDVRLTADLFSRLVEDFPKGELKVIDLTLRMFIDPTLELNLPLLESHLVSVKDKKAKLLAAAQADRDTLMSNDKFAELLMSLGVEPPKKISARTGKETWAFAKTDEGFKELLSHPDPRVQTLVGARLGTKTTLEESRTQRFIDIALRGSLPVPIKYYAAHTGRWGGDDKINLQNLPSRGANAGRLKAAITAPKGYVIIDCDSSQIEARTVAWLAGQQDLVDAFAKGEDVYKIMASAIYNTPMEEVAKEQRFVGKTCVAEGTLVLSDSGWKPIESITINDKLWDGDGWVCHQGLLYNGTKETLNLCGVWLTPDHELWSGTRWLQAQSVVADADTLCQVLGTGAENLPLQATWKVSGAESKPSLLNATAMVGSTPSIGKTLNASNQPVVISALKKQRKQSGTGLIPKLCHTMGIEHAYLIGSHPQSAGAITHPTVLMNITENEGLSYATNGEPTALVSYGMFKPFRGGITRVTKWIGRMWTKGTSREIYDSCLAAVTYKTNERSRILKPVYDILNSGPKNRFTILTDEGPVIAHNCVLGCGYGMGAAKFQLQLKTFGVDTDIDECKRIIDVYRGTYPSIPALWRQGQKCLESIPTVKAVDFGVVDAVFFDPREYGFRLPSGLWQRYEGLKKVEDAEGKAQYEYWTRRGAVKIYGGKVVENICQAVARCVIAEQMLRISKRYKVVLTVHDAVACIAPEAEAEEAQRYVEECMRWRPSWASTLPLNCESGMGKSYGDC